MTQDRYSPQDIEQKWQERWQQQDAFACDHHSDKPKYYVLEMFPYPSGNIHMGHVRNYSIGDVVARCKRMQGFNVLHPMGWDAFGLPAENAAIKHNIHPSVWTHANIDNMRAQLKRLGYSYDWDREVATCDEPYYRWEQLFFLRWLEKGLVYRKKASQNWCPHCNTVLANEQVVDGLCWRCDTPVVQKELTQWFLKITDYADELLADLSKLEGGWPDRVLSMQRNWIGKSVGAEITFPLESGEGDIKVFTTRPDTVFGVTFMTLAPEHPLVESLISGKPNEAEARAFIERTHNMDRIDRQSDSLEKEGVFTGSYCLNPFTGRQVPIWLGNFVLAEYGTGAVMAVPCGDQRDFEFARKYDLPIVPIILDDDDRAAVEASGETIDTFHAETVDWDCAHAAEGTLVQSGKYTGMRGGKHSEGEAAIVADLEAMGCGRRKVEFRLRDWLISRQRYWGNPIPAIHCEHCGIVPVPEDQLPVTLPENLDLGAGETLAECKDFYETTCPVCGRPAKRETDTMDTFTCSSWYYLRYTDPHNTELPFSKEAADRWMPVDNYIGGMEHTTLHLLYSRFFTKALRDLGLLSVDEPFTNLLCQGMVKDENGDTMSKSKGNVVPPSSVIEPYGADTMRLAILFIAPPEKDFDWDPKAVEGANRFIKRAWRIVWQLVQSGDANVAFDKSALDEVAMKLYRERHRTIAKCTEDFDRGQFNTAISAVMELVNAASAYLNATEGTDRDKALCYGVAKDIVSVLAPICPFWADELWHEALGCEGNAYTATWPEFDLAESIEDTVQIVVQVLGKVRGRIDVARDASNEEMQAAAEAAVAKWLEGKTVVKAICVPGKLVNLVVK